MAKTTVKNTCERRRITYRNITNVEEVHDGQYCKQKVESDN